MLNFNECDFKTINHIEPPLLKPACDYAKQGISVFPCCHEGEGVKKPVIGGGFKSASTNAEQVNAWWIEHPMALIGAPTGEPMGAFVLDIDVKANENGYDTLADLEAKHGALPSTRQVTTPSGGAHLYFLHPGSGTKVKNSVRKLGPGLDIRGDGGYVILPPSKIGEDSYELVIDAPIAPAPQWLLDLVCPKILPETSNRPTPKQGHKAPSASGNIALPCTTSVVTATRYGAAALKNECAKVENAQVGRRNDQLNRSAFALGRLVAGNEVSHELAVEMLKPAAQKCGLPDSEITKTIECGLEAGKKSPLRKTGVASPYLESGNSGKTGRIQPVNGLEIGSVQQESVPEAQAYPEEALLTPVIPDGYVITESGTFAIEYKKGEPIHVYLGPPLEFVGLFHNSSFDGWGVVVRWNDIDGHPKTHSFEHAALCDSRQSWRAEMSDRGWPGDPAPKARQLLAKLMLRATPPKRILAANQVGWCGDCFVLPDESVIGDQEKEVILRGPDKDLTFEMKGSLEGWSTTIGKLCRGNSRLLFAVCASLSAPLLKLINGDGGGFHYFGDSSSGKTTTLFVGMSVWASPQAIRSWRTTANGVEGVLALHNNLTLCLDEVGEADSRDVGEIVYKIGNGQGKTRMNAEAKLKKTDKWLCQVLSTGENAIVDVIMAGSGQYKAGQEVRFIDLPADPGKGLGVFEHLHDHRTPGEFSGSIKQACHENYGGLGRAFVSKVTEKMQDLKIELIKEIEDRCKEMLPSGACAQVDRVCKKFALSAVAGEFAVEHGLVPWVKGEPTAAARQCFRDWLDNRGHAGNREPAQILDYIRLVIQTHGETKFQWIEGGQQIHERWGFKRKKHNNPFNIEYILTSEQYKHLFRQFTIANVTKVLVEKGIIQYQNNKKPDYTVKVANLPGIGRKRCYILDLNEKIDEHESNTYPAPMPISHERKELPGHVC